MDSEEIYNKLCELFGDINKGIIMGEPNQDISYLQGFSDGIFCTLMCTCNLDVTKDVTEKFDKFLKEFNR